MYSIFNVDYQKNEFWLDPPLKKGKILDYSQMHTIKVNGANP